MKMNLILVVLVLIFKINIAHADNYGPAVFEIKSLMPVTGGMYIELETVFGSGPTCSGSWHGNQFFIPKDQDNYNGLSSALLAAFVAGKNITKLHYYFRGDGSCSYGNEHNVTAFKIIK